MNRIDLIILSNLIIAILSFAASILISIYIFKKIKQSQGFYIAIIFVLLFLIMYGSIGGNSLDDYTLDSKIDDKIDNYFKANKENHPKTFIFIESKKVAIFHSLLIKRELYFDENKVLQIYDTHVSLNGFTADFKWKEKPEHSSVQKVGKYYVFNDLLTNYSKILIFYISTFNTQNNSKIPIRDIENAQKNNVGYFNDKF